MNKSLFTLFSLALLLGCMNEKESVDSKKHVFSEELLKAFESLKNTNYFKQKKYTLDLSNSITVDYGNDLHATFFPVINRDNESTNARNATPPEAHISTIYNSSGFLYGLETVNFGSISLTTPSLLFTGNVSSTFFDNDYNSVVDLEFYNGTLIGVSAPPYSGPDACCGCSVRGIAACVGYKFQNNSPFKRFTFEEVGCYIAFGPCLGYRFGDCMVTECGWWNQTYEINGIEITPDDLMW